MFGSMNFDFVFQYKSFTLFFGFFMTFALNYSVKVKFKYVLHQS